MKPLGIYIQFPFCQTKCTYCNFHTGVVSSARFVPYVESVCKEIGQHLELYLGAGLAKGSTLARPDDADDALASDFLVDTVYMGGGTPSLLDPDHLHRMIAAIRRAFRTRLSEITLEADPETIDGQKAAGWAQAGINRISF